MVPRDCGGDCKCLIVKVGRVAQLVEQCPFKAWVAGSNPAALTIQPYPPEAYVLKTGVCAQNPVSRAGLIRASQALSRRCALYYA